jgi:adenosylhomocysteine nucleosidase
VALVCALEAERRALRSLAGPGVELVCSGMGAAAAARAAESLLGRAAPPRALVAVGFCGALDPALRAGDLVAAERVLDERGGEALPADPALLAAAPGRRGTLVSAVRLVRAPAGRARLRALDGGRALAVDLESAALARAAAAAGVPFLALRAVTDAAGDRLPDLERLVDARGRPRPAALVRHLARRPADLAALARLGLGARKAGAALRGGLAALVAGPA